MRTGAEMSLPSDVVALHTARQWDEGLAGQGVEDTIEWPAMMRLMQRNDPSFMS